jgi:phosphopantetheinyl transferase
MRSSVKQVNEIITAWTGKYPLCGAVVELPEIYMNLDQYTNTLFTGREQESIYGISNRKRRASRIAGRIAARKALIRFDSGRFSEEYGSIEILNDEKGMPYLSKNKDMTITISHSGNIAIAVVSKRKIGVDIEMIDKRPESFIQCFFEPSEQKWIRELNDYKDHRANYLWTRKEAVSKLLGLGGEIPFRSISVLDSDSSFTFDSHFLNRYCISLALYNEFQL